MTNLADAQRQQKADFIKHASNTQLASFVNNPVEVAKVTEEYEYGAGHLRLTSQQPGDIGTQKNCLVQFSKNQTDRFNFKQKSGSVTERRYDRSQSKMESLSKHRKQPIVNFENYTHRGADVFQPNQFVQVDSNRRKIKPSSTQQFYDNYETKDRTLKRPINIVPKFDKQLARPSQVIQHDYPFDQVDTDPNSDKQRWTVKRTQQPIPLAKVRGREDNLMYKLSDGYNLEDKTKQTFFDSHNILDLFSIGKSDNDSATSLSNSRSIQALKKYRSTSHSALKVIQQNAKKQMEALKMQSAQEGNITFQQDRASDSDENLSESQLRGKYQVKHFNFLLDRKIGLNGHKDQEQMSLEDRILHGVYKA